MDLYDGQYCSMRSLIRFSAIVLILFFGCKVGAYSSQDCVRCHKEGSTESSIYISIKDFMASVHGEKITCQDCHTGIQDECHIREKGSGAVKCNKCHNQENRHGMLFAVEHRPKCYSCHTKHSILEKEKQASSVNSKRLKETCKDCHLVECGRRDYLSWFPSIRISTHGKQDLAQTYDRGNCLGCHQGKAAHGDVEVIDDQSCYRCHDLRGKVALWGKIHPTASLKKQPSIFAAAIVYQVFLVVLLWWGGFRLFISKLSWKTKER